MRLKVKESGPRLDVYLARHLASRSQAQKAVVAGAVTVNGITAKPATQLEAGDVIEFHPISSPKASLPQLDFKVVYQDDDLLVIEKPAGVPVEGSKTDRRLLDFAGRHTSDPDKIRPGIVHRLDRDTSGLLIIAKTAGAKAFIQQAFKARRVEKTYLALVRGHLEPARAIISLPIARSHSLTQRAVAAAGRAAETSYSVQKYYQGFSLVEVTPKTGRTHQIRVHFSYLGHPIAGDMLYGQPTPRLSRHFLHAAKLSFTGPSGQLIKLESSLPADLADFLTNLAPV